MVGFLPAVSDPLAQMTWVQVRGEGGGRVVQRVKLQTYTS